MHGRPHQEAGAPSLHSSSPPFQPLSLRFPSLQPKQKITNLHRQTDAPRPGKPRTPQTLSRNGAGSTPSHRDRPCHPRSAPGIYVVQELPASTDRAGVVAVGTYLPRIPSNLGRCGTTTTKNTQNHHRGKQGSNSDGWANPPPKSPQSAALKQHGGRHPRPRPLSLSKRESGRPEPQGPQGIFSLCGRSGNGSWAPPLPPGAAENRWLARAPYHSPQVPGSERSPGSPSLPGWSLGDLRVCVCVCVCVCAV